MLHSSLAELSNDQVVTLLYTLLGQERRRMARVVGLLGEVEERRIHLELACSSMYDFATRKLGLSEGEATRRIRTARLSRRFPQILEALGSGAVTMTNVLLVERILSSENVERILSEITRKPKLEVHKVIARWAPRPDIVASMTASAGAADPSTRAPPSPETFAGGAPARHTIMPRSPGRHEVQFMASDELRAKIEQAQDLLRHRIPNGDLAAVVERAFDVLVWHLRLEKFGRTDRPQRTPRQSADPGHVSNEVKREVASRDEERCAFVGTNGERCPARGFLEFDHVHPRALGGDGSAENVRLLCRAHNALAAERVFGRERVDRRLQHHPRQQRYASPEERAGP
jgi:hypothetical protein